MSTFQNDINISGSAVGVTSITWDASNDKLLLNDGVTLAIGNGSDLTIDHNGTDTFIKNNTGTLKLRADAINFEDKDSSIYYMRFIDGESVELYEGGTKRFETASNDQGGGVIVTGKIVGTAATVGGGVTINNTGIDAGIAAGIVTAYQFWGDGSNITGIAAGGSGEFNTSISGATQYDVTTSMATAYTANASSDHRTIVHSIHICNISAAEASISGEIQASFSFAHTIPVPAGSAVELLKQPKVLGPSETIELQSDTASAL